MAITMIVGLSATGKSTLSKSLAVAHPGHCLFHLDSMLHLGHDRALKHWETYLHKYIGERKHAIVEGCMGFQLMLHMYMLYAYVPETIYMCTCSRNVRHARHVARGTNVPSQQDVMLFAALRQWQYEVDKMKVQPNIVDYDSSMY